MAAYDSIDVEDRDRRMFPSNGDSDDLNGQRNGTRSLFKIKCNFISMIAAILISLVFGDWIRMKLSSRTPPMQEEPSNSPPPLFDSDAKTTDADGGDSAFNTKQSALAKANLKLPTGVNLGSWLSLEDWFYVGQNGAVEVASPDDAIAASCLPPLHLDESTGPRWNSETDLLSGLVEHYQQELEGGDEGQDTLGGYPNKQKDGLEPWGKAIQTFHAFRSSYIDFDEELKTLKDLGIKYVRVPVSWCWTDHDPSELVAKVTTVKVDDDGDEVEVDGWSYMEENEVKEKFTCLDPFFEEDGVRWPAIPRNLVISFLKACSKHGIGATLDIHTYPGGTSIGTFSGVWPRYSRFWTHGDQPATNEGKQDVGRTILKDFISWVESLAESEPEAFLGLRAISPMNEPAHLSGLYDGKKPIRTDRETFLPPLPKDSARKYLSQLNDGIDSQSDLTQVPDGNHLRVLLWLRDAVDTFRKSKLPSLGKELHVNVHESLFPNEILPNYKEKVDFGLHPGSLQVFGAWWRATTSHDERSSWAVLDIHHYHAWGLACAGTVEGAPTGGYACSDVAGKTVVLAGCAQWASVYRSTLEKECGQGLKLASAEFSASTHHSVRHACNDVSTLKMSFDMQVAGAEDADVELFWWSYKMPYGGAFRRAWSFKHLMYLLGVLPQPDEGTFHCGDHIPPHGEPKDSSG